MPFDRHAALISAIFAVTAVAGPAMAQADAAATFAARYVELRAAMFAHDVAGVAKVMAPEYQVTDLQGETRTGADMMERMAKVAARAPDPSRKMETKVLSVTVTGDSATVEQQLIASGKRTADDGAEHAMEMTLTSTDTWARCGEAWMLVKSVQTGRTLKRDGEVFFQEGK